MAAEKVDRDPLMKFGYGGFNQGQNVPIFHVSQNVVDQVLKATLKKSLADLEADIDKDLMPKSAVLADWKAEGAEAKNMVWTPSTLRGSHSERRMVPS